VQHRGERDAEKGLQLALDVDPVGVEHGVQRGVAVAVLHDAVLAENRFLLEAAPLEELARNDVSLVGLCRYSAITCGINRMTST